MALDIYRFGRSCPMKSRILYKYHVKIRLLTRNWPSKLSCFGNWPKQFPRGWIFKWTLLLHPESKFGFPHMYFSHLKRVMQLDKVSKTILAIFLRNKPQVLLISSANNINLSGVGSNQRETTCAWWKHIWEEQNMD